MTNNVANFIDEILKAEIFKNFSKDDLLNFLAKSKINFFNKNQLIFMQNQKALHINLIVRGSAKLALNDIDGNEVIAEIVLEKEIINDVFSPSYSCNIIALEDVLILQIPINEFENKLKNDAKFLYQFLQANVKKNQKLIHHILSLKTNSAKEKLGNFILGMAFNDGEKNKMLI